MSGIPGPRSGISRPTKLPAPSTLPRAAPMKRTRDGDDVGVYKFEGAAGQPTKKAKPTTMAPPTLTSRTSTTAATRKPPTTASTLTTRRPLATKNANPVNSRSKLTMNSTIASSAPATEKPKGKPKRAPWDLKGKLEDMEGVVKEKDKHMESIYSRLEALENHNAELKSDVETKEISNSQSSEELASMKRKNDQYISEIDELKKKMKNREEELEEEHKKKQRIIEDLEYSKSTLERRNKSLEDELNAKQAELSGLKTTVAEVTASSAGIEAKYKSTQMQLENTREKMIEFQTISTNQAEEIKVFQEKQRAFETERRVLFNTIQELKGNIRVFCRIRPLIGQEIEKNDGEIKHITVSSDKSLDIYKPQDSPNSSGGTKSDQHFNFDFDRVFGHQSTQEEVFDEVSQLVQSAIDGYNVCIFAYGQTGSGKTYTMEGDENMEKLGIIPKTITKIFEETHGLVEKGWSYKLEASFLEIYNEEIRDLLATEKGLKYDIKKVDTKSNEIYVSNLKVEDVTNGEKIGHLLKRAKKNRAVAATNCNERSSRSHSVFILKIVGKNSITSESCTGSLNLVDLAGSERLKDSGSTGLRLDETKNINSSLSALSKVIMALANNKDGHIPYRDSKLTHLLMNSLGGNSKTLMFVNLSPKENHWNETLNSLRFAKRVNNCQIGTASKKVNTV